MHVQMHPSHRHIKLFRIFSLQISSFPRNLKIILAEVRFPDLYILYDSKLFTVAFMTLSVCFYYSICVLRVKIFKKHLFKTTWNKCSVYFGAFVNILAINLHDYLGAGFFFLIRNISTPGCCRKWRVINKDSITPIPTVSHLSRNKKMRCINLCPGLVLQWGITIKGQKRLICCC